MYPLQIRQINETNILIEWPQRIDEEILEEVIFFTETLQNVLSKKIINLTPAFASVQISYACDADMDKEKKLIVSLYQGLSKKKVKKVYKTWHIPVCYDEAFAIDIENFCSAGETKEEIKTLHTSATYRVYMIGFLPGFLYLGGLPEKLHLHRKQTPVLKVPKGSVAIGGNQTGIYPMESPGGWHIIGRTPLTLFDIQKKVPTPIRQGDYIRFYAIDNKTFDRLK